MEFNERIQELRKRQGLTQEELAAALFVSRAAVSKWESGRGYPNLDSLKAMAKFFSVTIDELLSGGEALTAAEENRRQKQKQSRRRIFGLLDCCAVLLLFLPLFAERSNGVVQAVSLLGLDTIAPYLKAAYFAAAVGMVVTGALTLLEGGCALWKKHGNGMSLALNALALLLFVAGLQPYAAVLMFVFLAVKASVAVKGR